MISERMQQALNEQINREFYSAYLYLAMSAYCDARGLPGFAHWMRMQFEEERMHAIRFFDYLRSRDGKIELGSIEEPPSEFGSPTEIFEKTLEHERFITGCIDELMDVALAERDYATQSVLQWFVNEQVEEESGVNEILAELRLVGDARGGLMMLNQKLGGRAAPSIPA